MDGGLPIIMEPIKEKTAPMKAATKELEEQTASHPDELRDSAREIGIEVLGAREDQYRKVSAADRFKNNTNLVPKNAHGKFELRHAKETADHKPERARALDGEAKATLGELNQRFSVLVQATERNNAEAV